MCAHVTMILDQVILLTTAHRLIKYHVRVCVYYGFLAAKRCPTGIALPQLLLVLEEINGLIKSALVQMQGLADFLLEGELSFVYVSFFYTFALGSCIYYKRHTKNKGQAVRTYLFRFYTAMTIYLISVTLINSSAFIFP